MVSIHLCTQTGDYVSGFLQPPSVSEASSAEEIVAAAAQTSRLPVSLSASLIGVSLALSLAAGGLASYFMARRMARMKPADILRQM